MSACLTEKRDDDDDDDAISQMPCDCPNSIFPRQYVVRYVRYVFEVHAFDAAPETTHSSGQLAVRICHSMLRAVQGSTVDILAVPQSNLP